MLVLSNIVSMHIIHPIQIYLNTFYYIIHSFYYHKFLFNLFKLMYTHLKHLSNEYQISPLFLLAGKPKQTQFKPTHTHLNLTCGDVGKFPAIWSNACGD